MQTLLGTCASVLVTLARLGFEVIDSYRVSGLKLVREEIHRLLKPQAISGYLKVSGLPSPWF